MKKLFLTLLLLCLAAAARADCLTLPSDTQIVEAQAFSGDASVTEVILPSRLRRIETQAFTGTSLRAVTLPASLEYIADDAFDPAVAFRVTSGSYAAQWAQDLEKTILDGPELPDGVTYDIIASGADRYAVITGYTGEETELVLPDALPDGTVIRAIGEEAFLYNDQLTAIRLPGQLRSIGRQAFQGCTALLSVGIPDSVEEIGDSAFFDCDRLCVLVLPACLTSFGQAAFGSCGRLLEVSISAEADQAGQAFIDDSAIETIHYLSGAGGTVPEWTSMYGRMERVCADRLQTVTFEAGLTAIGDGVFNTGDDFLMLREIVLPDTLRRIGERCFNGLAHLETVSFPAGLEAIGSDSFCQCTSLPLPSLPGVTLGENVFTDCLMPED